MLAGENALHHYCPKIQGNFVQVKCDNSKNQGDQIFLTLRYGPENSQVVPNKQSDPSSFEHKRRVQSYTRCFFQAKSFTGLAPSSKIARRIFLRHGLPQIDLFATELSSQCPFYMTWEATDTDSLAIDALRQP